MWPIIGAKIAIDNRLMPLKINIDCKEITHYLQNDCYIYLAS